MRNNAKDKPFIDRGYKSFERKTGIGAYVKWALLLIAGVVGVLWLASVFGSREIKAAINQMASQTGIGPTAISWSAQAEAAATKLIARDPAGIATAIQEIAHPKGKAPKLTKSNISKLDDRIVVELKIAFVAGLADDPFESSVKWDISKTKHVSALMMDDGGMFAIAEADKPTLDDYFRLKLYPAFNAILQASAGN